MEITEFKQVAILPSCPLRKAIVQKKSEFRKYLSGFFQKKTITDLYEKNGDLGVLSNFHRATSHP